MKKIAFLFLLIDNPNFPSIWDKYLENNEDKYSIYIHPKYPENHTWKKNRIIKHLKETAWGKIVEAEISLLKEAYKDKDNYKFITISESCVPIKSFNTFYNDIMSDDKSWIKIMKISNYDHNERIVKFIKSINTEYIYNKIFIPDLKSFIKHYARFCLNRKHVHKLLIKDHENKLDFFYKMPIGDEFFLTILNLNKDEYKDFNVTFDDWEYVHKEIEKINNIIKDIYKMNDILKKTKNSQEKINKMNSEIEELKKIKNDIGKNPKTITILNKEDLDNIKNTKSYFYRKFSKNSDIGKYWDNIY